jgi:tRNA dimethylallyltransferase
LPINSPTGSALTFPITQPVLVLVGPTAIGKTALSLELASIFSCEIISMDSMQVYRRMDIGTAKVTKEERRKIPHHLIDIADPDEEYDAERFVDDSCKAIKDILDRNKTPLITGGTGLYLRSLAEGLFAGGIQYPELRAQLKERLANEGSSKLHDELKIYDCISALRINVNDTQRLIRALEIYHGSGIPWSQHLLSQAEKKKAARFTNMLQIGLTCDREILYGRINERCSVMINAGLEQEVQELLEVGYNAELKSMKSIGYRHMVNYLRGFWDKQEMERYLARDTRHYAKRQFTWFLNTADIHWFDISAPAKIIGYIAAWYRQHS